MSLAVHPNHAAALVDPQAPARTRDGHVVIATVCRASGETGVHTHCQALRQGLVRYGGLHCELCTPFDGGIKWFPIFAFRPLVLRPLNRTWGTRWYRRWHEAALRENLVHIVRRGGTAAVIAQCPLSARAALDARQRVNGRFPIAMVCHFNHSEAQEYRDRGELADERYYRQVLALEKSVLEAVDHVVYVSDWARRVVEQDRGIRPRASSVIFNGIARDVNPSKLCRAGLGIGQDELVLINVGTLEPRKGQIALVDVFARLRDEFTNARLVLVGDGPSRGRIEERIVERGLASAVSLLGMRKDVPDLLQLADVYVHAAAMENCPMALIEAARAGLPLAAAPAGGVPELLAALGGIAIDPHHPDAAAASLRPLLADRTLRLERGRLARTRFEQRFTLEAMTSAYLGVLGCGTRPSREAP